MHEAGHAAVCLHFGVEFDQVTIRQFDGEVSRRLSESDQRSMSQAAREEIVIALAGAAAQRMFYPDQPEVESFFCSRDDQAYVTKIISNPEYRISEAYRKEADANAKSLVSELREIIAVIANALLERHSLTFAEVKRIYDSRREAR